MVDRRNCCAGNVGNADWLTPGVIGIVRNGGAAGIDQADHVTLEVQHVIIVGEIGAAIVGIPEGVGITVGIVNKVQNPCAVGFRSSLPLA